MQYEIAQASDDDGIAGSASASAMRRDQDIYRARCRTLMGAEALFCGSWWSKWWSLSTLPICYREPTRATNHVSWIL